MNKTCNVYTLNRQIGPRAVAFFLLAVWTMTAFAVPDDEHPFVSGYVSCEAALNRSLTTLLDETFKKFRTASLRQKVKGLHLVAEVAKEQGKKRRFSEGEQLQLGLLLKSVLSYSDAELLPFGRELIFIALKLTVNQGAPKIPMFETNWEQFLKRVTSLETDGYASHRAALFGTLALLEIQKMRTAENPALPLQKAFNYVTCGWSEDFEITMHPAMMAIDAALRVKMPEGSKLALDLAMTGLVALVEKSLMSRSQILAKERFSNSYLWMVRQIELVSRSPGLARFPALTQKVTELQGTIGINNSHVLN